MRNAWSTWLRLSALLLCAAGCAPRLQVSDKERGQGLADAAGDLTLVHESAKLRLFANADGNGYEVLLDATSYEEPVYFSFDGVEVAAAEEWDLAFKRFEISANGGSSGPGGVAVAALADKAYDALKRAPDVRYDADSKDRDNDDDEAPENAFNTGASRWYDYDPKTHELSPRPVVFVIRAPGARFFKLRFLGYYDERGDSGHVRFEYAPLEAPP